MPIEKREPTPQEWAKETWRSSPLEILVPAIAGLCLGQLVLALLGLRSVHIFFLLVALAAAGFTAARTFAFLYQLSKDHRLGRCSVLTLRDTQELFLPLILSVVIYGIIAPNYIVGAIFGIISLPLGLALLYLTKHYTTIVYTEAPHWNFNYAEMLNEFKTLALHARLMYARLFRRTPDFRQP